MINHPIYILLEDRSNFFPSGGEIVERGERKEMVAFGDKKTVSQTNEDRGQLTSPARPDLGMNLAPLDLLDEVHQSGIVGGLIRFPRATVCHSSGDPVHDRLGHDASKPLEYVNMVGRGIKSTEDILSRFNLDQANRDAGEDTAFPIVIPVNRQAIVGPSLN